ncbi:hypothetical protein [Staphylococcus aureus]|uniref:Phage protein n=1 Tax=Staphylococcus aureus TaxID=1280 RepID=A0A659ZYS1_STAAU|nr:hypothetical protein [Staphylococcus aureus]EHM62494.1 hypothetical protein SA21178_2805 [Staphylococcus aureus subsp. aureus 21178]KSW08815.1 hypothetical protein OO23_0202160 [Staphylococcus aureus]MBT2241034.1 hypothetical protein [Staphylococcus aureus]MBU6912951.1 hypothetical protein [Staphylococcus aureus]MBU6924069.1 hypothetical protein [Staphylococcus aureus]
MAILEGIFEELKLLNKNLRVLNTELSTVDSSIVQEKVKEAPMPKDETAQLESVEEVKETSADLTKDYVLSVGIEFLKKADTSDKKEFRNKLNELGADKLSTIKEEHYEKIVDFMKARINA